MGGGEFLGDLASGVAGPDDDDRPGRDVAGTPVFGAVQLDHGTGQVGGHAGNEGFLERAGGDDDLAGREGASAGVDAEPVGNLLDADDRTMQSDREREVGGVVAQVVRHHVLGRVVAVGHEKRHAGKPVVLRRSEQA